MRHQYISKDRTQGQLKLEKLLNEIGFQTVLEAEFGVYRIDVYVPELKTAFEYDGAFHMKKRDQLRDFNLKEWHGLETIRIKGPKELKREIIQQKIDELFNGGK